MITFFNGNFSQDPKQNQAINLLLDCLRYCIWEGKLTKSKLSFYTIANETWYLCDTICRASQKLNFLLTNCTLINADGDGDDGADAGRDGRPYP